MTRADMTELRLRCVLDRATDDRLQILWCRWEWAQLDPDIPQRYRAMLARICRELLGERQALKRAA